MSRGGPQESHEARVEHLLRDILTELERLNQRKASSSLSRGDRAELAKILPAIAGVLGSHGFLSRELVDHASPALQVVLRGRSAKQIGRLLRRAEGQPIGGYVVVRDGSEINVIVWRVMAC